MKITLKLILNFVLLCTCLYSLGQNLVPNNGFDIFTTCPTTSSQFNLTPPWSMVNNASGTPDYMNACATGAFGVPTNYTGYQQPVSGHGYYGLMVYSNNVEVREYLMVPLTTPLVSGTSYTIGFYISRGNVFRYATDHFGAYLSNGPISGSGNFDALPYNPQIDNPLGNVIYDTANWVLISGTYTAVGGENYITIGNFHDDLNTTVIIVDPTSNSPYAYYLVDEVFVIPFSDVQITGANTICLGDSVTLTATGDTNLSWVDSLNLTTILATDTILTISPIVTTTYLVYGSTDTVSFTVNVIPRPNINLGNDTTICIETPIILDATTQNANYLWQDSSTKPILNTIHQGIYWVRVSVNECVSIDTISVFVENCDIVLKIPNIFTPNNDGINDFFMPIITKGIVSMNTIIHNRWGNKIFETTDLLIKWSGKDVPVGTYFWIVQYTDDKGVKNELTGHVTLLK